MDAILERLGELGVVPVASIPSASDAPRLGEALLQRGLPCVEITFRTSAAEEAIQRIVPAHPKMLVGAGTVLSVSQAEKAVSAGARFVVSPGFDPKIVSWCLEHDIAVTPGVATPTEINMALDHGLSVLKFFPAEALGGVKMLKAIAAPYDNLKFMPTGGVNPENLANYLRHPAVHCCGGSWIVERKLIVDGKFDEITRLTLEAVDIVRQARSEGGE